MRMDPNIARDMVLFRNRSRRNFALGPVVMNPRAVMMLHVEQFRRYISRADVDAGHIEIIDDPSTLTNTLIMQNNDRVEVPANTCDARELASYLEIFGDLPPDTSKAAISPPKPKRKPKPKLPDPKPKILEW